MFRVVGNQLGRWAQEQNEEELADSFARSAFNRYYYACFLSVRGLLEEIKGPRKRYDHKGIPDELLGSVRAKIKNTIRQQKKNNLLQPKKAQDYERKLQASLAELSDTLRVGYDLRVVADYRPQERVRRRGTVFILGNEKLSTASNWPIRAERNVGEILKVWKKIARG